MGAPPTAALGRGVAALPATTSRREIGQAIVDVPGREVGALLMLCQGEGGGAARCGTDAVAARYYTREWVGTSTTTPGRAMGTPTNAARALPPLSLVDALPVPLPPCIASYWFHPT
jgi:hypothetical protein